MTTIYGLYGMEGGAQVAFPARKRAKPAGEPSRSTPSVPGVRAFTTVAAAIEALDALDGELRKFEIALADSLQDYLGVNMAMITDRALARGWEPCGFVQKNGFRVYRYETMP